MNNYNKVDLIIPLLLLASFIRCGDSGDDSYLKEMGSSISSELRDLGGFASTGASYAELAKYYSPRIYEDTACRYRADYVIKFDYDGNIRGNDNWENLKIPVADYRGYVYASIIESETHYFIVYAFFHNQDYQDCYLWCDGCDSDLTSHENDMEGVMVAIEKDGSYYGNFLLAETEAHDQFYQYALEGDTRVSDGHEDIDYRIPSLYDGSHIEVYIESKGHGVCYWHDTTHWPICQHPQNEFPGGDGVIYNWSTNPEAPSSPNDRDVGYGLIPIQTTLWRGRHYIGNGRMYDDPFEYCPGDLISGAFDGDTWDDDAANPPWGWDDPDDGPVYRGDWFIDPAYSMDVHFTINTPFSLIYTYNPFACV